MPALQSTPGVDPSGRGQDRLEQLASRCRSLQGPEALRTSAVLQKPKTVTLRALCSWRKFGVASRSCREVLRKGCLHFQLPEHGSRLCLYEDGTELTEDYFPSVLDNAELVLLTSGQCFSRGTRLAHPGRPTATV
uniref:DNA fragmentation factor subunit beta n=1 Tax=Rhinopithecus roxellana TaxID=61622 RepID=A0A2K6N7H0_RHIRO